VQESHDLSRRVITKELKILTFKEYFEIKHNATLPSFHSMRYFQNTNILLTLSNDQKIITDIGDFVTGERVFGVKIRKCKKFNRQFVFYEIGIQYRTQIELYKQCWG